MEKCADRMMFNYNNAREETKYFPAGFSMHKKIKRNGVNFYIKLVLAEKPSIDKTLSAVLNANKRGDGFFTSKFMLDCLLDTHNLYHFLLHL